MGQMFECAKIRARTVPRILLKEKGPWGWGYRNNSFRAGFDCHPSCGPRCRTYCNFAYSALACLRMGMSASASFQSVRKSA